MLGAVWRRLAVIAATVLVVLMTSSSLASARNAGRPTSEVQDFAHDAASRLLAKTGSNAASKAHVGAYRYGEGAGPHAVTTAGSEAIAYDAGGFMRERCGVGGSTWAYAWDGRGRIAFVSRDASVVQTSSYDAAGVRVVKREGASTTLYLAPDFEVRDGLATTYVKAGHSSVARVEEPAFATTFFPDVAPLGAGAAAEPAPDGVITAADAWVVHAAKAGLVDLPPPAAAKAKTADVDKMLASAARRMLGADATQTTYVSHDHLGSPSLETDERGEVVARRWHGPYGEVRGASGAWAEARGFTGKERDETTGLADHGARYLDTRLGRWTAPDPLAVRELGGAELDVYGYVEGRVTAAADPTGNEGVEVRARQRELASFSADERKQVAATQGRILETAVVVGAGGFACAAVPAVCTAIGRVGAVGYLATSASPQEASEKALAIAEAEVGARVATTVASPAVRAVAEAAYGAKLARITSMPKGMRPPPASYMSPERIREHLSLFEGGAVRIGPSAPTGTIGRTETWVMPRGVADDAIKRSGGDVAMLEKLLGLDAGYLGSSPVRVDISSPSNVRIPTGNEYGANSFWRAGGMTSGGVPEAVIDPVDVGQYTTKSVF